MDVKVDIGEATPNLCRDPILSSAVINRKNFWRTGDIDDIVMGNYPIESMEFPNPKGLEEEIQDLVGEEKPSSRGGILKLAVGLKENILIQQRNRQILVVDSHMYALPFILNLKKNNLIDDNVSMVHIDDHPDLGVGSGMTNVNLEDIFQRNNIRLLHSSFSPGTWMYAPLIKSGIIDFQNWQWLSINNKSHEWEFEEMTDDKGRLQKTDKVLQNPTLLDIDLDFIRAIEPMGATAITERLKWVAQIGRNTPFIIIATSPAYINEKRSIGYARQLVSLLEH